MPLSGPGYPPEAYPPAPRSAVPAQDARKTNRMLLGVLAGVIVLGVAVMAIAATFAGNDTPSGAGDPSPFRTATSAPIQGPKGRPVPATTDAEPADAATTADAPPPADATKPAPPPDATTEAAQPPADVYYANCAEAKAAGAAPLHRGDPGYRPGLDRDGDGVACET